MEDYARLALTCLQRGWRHASLGEDTFLFDERSEFLARVDRRIVRRLSGSTAPGPLSAVLEGLALSSPAQEAPQEPESEVVVSLSLLGVRVDVRCDRHGCAQAIARFYSASHLPPASSSPEVVVWCDWPDPGRHLFRSRPGHLKGVPLAGVQVQTLRSQRQPWTSTLPPLPALASWPFRDRFTGLHAATVRTTSGEGLLLAGARGAGKSTTALLLSERFGAQILADETSMVHCRTTMVEPFPHAVGIWRDGRKMQVPITEVCDKIGTSAAPITTIIVLKRRPEGSGAARRLSNSDALRELLPLHREAGASIGDSLQTLLNLVARTDSWSVEYSNPHELGDLVSEVAEESLR